MTIHIRAFTYEPKIPAVRALKCRQTIRPKGRRPVGIEDEILFHGWEGRPYRSKWSWRLKIKVDHVRMIRMWPEGVQFMPDLKIEPWEKLEWLAFLDGIPSWKEMEEGFKKMHKLTGQEFQIISWSEEVRA